MASGSRSYGDDLGRRFADQYGDWRNSNRSPQTKIEYYRELDNSQTHFCTRLAALHFNANNDILLSNLDPIDSHAFSCSWTASGDNRRCFHVTFKANVGNERRFFFAEILGIENGPPQLVRHCVMLGGQSTWSTNICLCSGMWHPRGGVGTFDFGRK